jgi:hypothetical protein
MNMNKIGWQKFEDLLQSQMESPFLEYLYSKASGGDYGDSHGESSPYEDEEWQDQGQLLIPASEKVMDSISLSTNFNCWMGYTNFNLTGEIQDKLNKMDGIEALKICGRYRFFIGVGKMFDFTEVRNAIEKSLGDAIGESKNEQEDRQVP